MPVAGAAVEHLDAGEVERGVADRHRLAGQLRRGLIGVALELDRGGAGGHGPDGLPQERGIQLGGGDEPGRARAPPLQRRRPGRGVHPHVVLVLDPGGEPAVELLQAVRHPAAGGGLAVGGDLDQELPPHCLEKPFDFAASLRPVRRRVSDPDAQLRAGHRDRLIDEARPVINVGRARQAPRRDRALERRGQVQRVLAPPPPVPGDEPGMIVQEGDQVGLPSPDERAVQDVAGPQHVRGLGLEPAEHHGPARGGQVLAGEMPLQRALRRRVPGGGHHDPPHLRRGPLHVLPLQRRRHRQHGLRGDRLALAVAGQQRLEPARPPGPDPPVNGLTRDLHPAPARPGVHLAGDAADHPAPLLRRQPLLQRRPDQPVPEQRGVLHPGPPQQPLMLCRRHPRHLPR